MVTKRRHLWSSVEIYSQAFQISNVKILIGNFNYAGQNKIYNLTIGEGKENSKLPHWEIGEMAYSAITRINKLKAKNQKVNAQAMLDEWHL